MTAINSYIQCRSLDLTRTRDLYVNSLMYNAMLQQMYDRIKVYREVRYGVGHIVQDYDKVSDFSASQKEKYIKSGLKFIANGKLAIILLAGGQATRMLSGTIKGFIDIGLPSRTQDSDT